MPPSLTPAQRRAQARAKAKAKREGTSDLPTYSTDPYERTQQNPNPPKRPASQRGLYPPGPGYVHTKTGWVKAPKGVKGSPAPPKHVATPTPKPKPLPVPDLTIDYEPDPNFRGSFDPKTGRYVPPKPGAPGGKPRRGRHLPDKYLEMGPLDYANWLLGVDDKKDRKRI